MILAHMRGPDAKAALYAAMAASPAPALGGLLVPISSGILCPSEVVVACLADLVLRSPSGLQEAALALLVGRVVEGGEGAGGPVAIAHLSVAVLASVAAKIDALVPEAAAASAAADLLAALAGPALAGRRGRGPSPVAEAVGHMGRSKRQRPAIVRRLADLLWDAPAAGGATTVTWRRYDCTAALYAIAGHPGARPDLAPALAPLIDLLRPEAAAAHRATAGLAAGALFRLAVHFPFQVSEACLLELPA